MKITHLVYAGLGGHTNVFFTLLGADKGSHFEYSTIFYGVEDPSLDVTDKLIAKNIPFNYVKKKPGMDWLFWPKVFKALKREKPNVVFLHSSYNIIPALFYGLFYKAKIVVRETQANHLKTKLEKYLLGISLMFADKVVFLTDLYQSQIKDKYKWLFDDTKVAVIPNGLDLGFFKPTKKNDSQTFSIGMLSRIVPIKDHETLIRALGQLDCKNLVLKIAGEGESMVKLQALAKELGVENKVMFLGRLSEDRIPAFLNELDLYVHATLGETMSTAIMQAQACGLPIIASDVMGVNNLITSGKNGILVECRNVEQMAQSIILLREDSKLRKSLGYESEQYAKELLSCDIMFESYHKLFVE
ncbi:glycosyltransferase family 4 protein [Fulvivirga kasyanovii]|nr:glycosyltransferase family 4 protein [Fulvivirga kasyanovii]